jgi:hypothetical protein
MGANAVTTVYDFTAGQVLTAAQMDNVNCGIPVFATTTTRDAAFGSTGEKALAEGQMAYIENIAGSAAVQYYDGSAWQTLVVGGMTYITGASFSAASTVIADGCFTSTYRNYMLIIEGASASGFPELRFYYRTGGVDNTNSSYFNGMTLGTETSGIAASYTGSVAYARIGNAGADRFSAAVTITAPQVAAKSGHTGTFHSVGGATSQYGTGGGYFNNTTQFDGIKILPASSTITGTYRIYGLADA